MIRIGVTGGIGSGKSTVCALFAGLGIPVYDSDLRARELMRGVEEGSAGGGELRRAIVELLGEGAYRGDAPDRAFIAGKVFSDKALLASLNAIVHPAVAKDFEAWAAQNALPPSSPALPALPSPPYLILESAILFESGFDRLVDRVVTVSALEAVRLDRVVARGGNSGGSCSRVEAMARMANQMTDAEREARADYIIDNGGGLDELAARVNELDNLLKQ